MSRYGCVGAMDADQAQRLHCSTTGAHNEDANKILHVGELLYFKSGKTEKTEGTGRVISVNGSVYTVEVLTGSFALNESMNLYRGKDRASKDCVGRGTVAQRDPVTFSGTGTVGHVYVQVGQHVREGDRLFSLLGPDAPRGVSPDVKASRNGIVGTVAVSPCQQVWKGELLCRVWLTDELEITAEVDEVNLHDLKVGSRVYVTLDTDKDTTLEAVVTEISSLGVTRQNASYYTVHTRLTEECGLMLGQSASLYLPEE
jgi:Multidrug resistance efflux pump